jgi:hypothetical protein
MKVVVAGAACRQLSTYSVHAETIEEQDKKDQ